VLLVDLDLGEPELMVSEGLAQVGHGVEILEEGPGPGAVRLRLRRG
jgi:hypothetical protein